LTKDFKRFVLQQNCDSTEFIEHHRQLQLVSSNQLRKIDTIQFTTNQVTMFRTIAVIASIVGAAAFAPATSVARSSALKMSFENALGAQAPLGFWDPLGLLKEADQERFDRLRYVETKHGRISMLAILGHLVTTAGVRLPGEIAYGVPFSSVKNGLAALDTIPAAGVAQIVAFIGLIELGFGARQEEIEAAQLNASGWDEETINKKLAIELNNGRAAQMGILALMVHEKLNNDPYIINTLLGAPVPFNQ
jgi:Chlorophyll A-B binding protein